MKADSKKRALLFNPPGDRKYIRDYFCAKVTKAHYYYHPTDLIYLSGTVGKEYEVQFLDAIAENLTVSECVRRIIRLSPDYILFLTAGISFENDMAVLSAINETHRECTMIGTGDIFREIGEEALGRYPFLEAIVLDFSTEDILSYLRGGDGELIPNIIYRYDGEIRNGKEVRTNGRFSIATPRWDLVKLDLYSYPFERHRQFASMLTDFGCPYTCTYCPIATIGFKLRSVDEVIEEVEFLKTLGVTDIYFRDQTFGINAKRTIELCSRLAPLEIGWTCFTRVDVLTEDLLRAFKAGGCHTVMFGIETVNEALLRQYEKNTTNDQALGAIDLCRRHGVDVVGFFIVGLPGDSRRSVLETIAFAKTSGIDFASFNIAMPRFGTTLREQARDSGIVDADTLDVDSSGDSPQWKGQPLSNDEIIKLHKHAFRSFYLRPVYLLRRLLRISTPHQFINFAREGLHLFLK